MAVLGTIAEKAVPRVGRGVIGIPLPPQPLDLPANNTCLYVLLSRHNYLNTVPTSRPAVVRRSNKLIVRFFRRPHCCRIPLVSRACFIASPCYLTTLSSPALFVVPWVSTGYGSVAWPYNCCPPLLVSRVYFVLRSFILDHHPFLRRHYLLCHGGCRRS